MTPRQRRAVQPPDQHPDQHPVQHPVQPPVQPVVMPPNRLSHFYLGGEAITALRGVPPPSPRSPEEWLGSVTARHGQQLTGQSRLPDGRLLREAVADDPDGWVGPHRPPGGPGDTGVLVKLLDAGQRLPVHVHPTRAFAARHLGSPYGKTEAWYVVGTSGPRPQVHVGLRAEVSADALSRAVADQDAAWLLDQLHPLDVRPGDVVHVPAGTPHAIGAGVLVVELQEPTDLSVLVEWRGFAAERDAFLGLDRPTALSAVDRRVWSASDVAAVHRHVPLDERSADPVPLLPAEAGRFFRAHLLAPSGDGAPGVEPGFGVLVALHGDGSLTWDGGAGGELALARGDVVVVPHGAGPWRVSGDVAAVLCRPSDTGPASPAEATEPTEPTEPTGRATTGRATTGRATAGRATTGGEAP